jgi:hypothetical protein
VVTPPGSAYRNAGDARAPQRIAGAIALVAAMLLQMTCEKQSRRRFLESRIGRMTVRS